MNGLILRRFDDFILVYVSKTEKSLAKFILFSTKTLPWTELKQFDVEFENLAHDLFNKLLMGVVNEDDVAGFWSN